MVENKKIVPCRHRGVNITSEELAENESEGTSAGDPSPPSRLQNDIQNMIDVMESGTPHFVYTSSSIEADNEESIISSTSVVSSVVKVRQAGINKDSSEASQVCSHSLDTCNDVSENLFDQPLCVQAVLPPAVLCMNPNCTCTHTCGVMQHIHCHTQDIKQKVEKKHRLSRIFEKLTGKENGTEVVPLDLYKMNVTQPKHDSAPPKRFVFDLIEGIPKPDVNTTGTNTKKTVDVKGALKKTHTRYTTKHSQYSGMVVTHTIPDDQVKLKHPSWCKNLRDKNRMQYKNFQDNPTRIDVYYFDHGNAAYYRTTDSPPAIMSELMAEKTEQYATKFWAEVFGMIYIGGAFFTTFILQFFRCVIHSILRPLTIGLLQLLSDYFFKPFLAVVFNALIQPPLIFFYNIFTSIRDLCDPISEGMGYFLREFALLCKSIRLFDIKRDKCKQCVAEASCKCNKSKEQCPV